MATVIELSVRNVSSAASPAAELDRRHPVVSAPGRAGSASRDATRRDRGGVASLTPRLLAAAVAARRLRHRPARRELLRPVRPRHRPSRRGCEPVALRHPARGAARPERVARRLRRRLGPTHPASRDRQRRRPDDPRIPHGRCAAPRALARLGAPRRTHGAPGGAAQLPRGANHPRHARRRLRGSDRIVRVRQQRVRVVRVGHHHDRLDRRAPAPVRVPRSGARDRAHGRSRPSATPTRAPGRTSSFC